MKVPELNAARRKNLSGLLCADSGRVRECFHESHAERPLKGFGRLPHAPRDALT